MQLILPTLSSSVSIILYHLMLHALALVIHTSGPCLCLINTYSYFKPQLKNHRLQEAFPNPDYTLLNTSYLWDYLMKVPLSPTK